MADRGGSAEQGSAMALGGSDGSRQAGSDQPCEPGEVRQPLSAACARNHGSGTQTQA